MRIILALICFIAMFMHAFFGYYLYVRGESVFEPDNMIVAVQKKVAVNTNKLSIFQKKSDHIDDPIVKEQAKNLTTALSKQRKEPNRKALRLSWMSRRIQLPPLQPLNRLLRQWQLQHRLLFRLKVSRLTNQKLKKKLITFLSAPVGPDSYRLKMLWSPSFFSCSASRFAVSKEEGQPHAGCSASTWFSGRL